MAIFFPITQPIKFYTWNDRLISRAQLKQVVNLRDQGMYQFNDPSLQFHRVIVLNALFEPVGEITDDLDIQQIGIKWVYTVQVQWDDFIDEGERAYVGVVDANVNKYMQNYMPNGDFATDENWSYEGAITIDTGNEQMEFDTGSTTTDTAGYDLPLKVGSEYSTTITVGQITGGASATLKNGTTTIGALSVGSNSFTFTATDDEYNIEFSSTGDGTVYVTNVTNKMSYADITPEWISTPFCMDDLDLTHTLIHGCANNDVFGMYFESTGFVPRVRVISEIRDSAPIQEVERSYLTDGTINVPYVQHVAQRQLRVQWMPAYLVNFMSIAFYLDAAFVDNVQYSISEEMQVQEDDSAPDIKAYIIPIALTDNAVSFKRVVNDPDDASCSIPLGGYRQKYTQENYLQKVTNEQYYPRS